MTRLGIVTIGQTPRFDVLPEMRRHWPDSIEVLEAGALDGMSTAQIEKLRPGSADGVLTTRLKSGKSAVVSKARLVPYLRNAIERVQKEGVDLILLLCTSDFSGLESKVLIVKPNRILHHFVRALSVERLGVVVPLPEQRAAARDRWLSVVTDVDVVSADPYGSQELIPEAAQALASSKSQLLVMDCMGFQEQHLKKMRLETDAPCALANAIVSRFIANLI